MTSGGSGIRSERIGTFVRIVIDRPDRLNSLSTEGLRALAVAVRDADGERTRVIVITGAGRAFCSGADLGGTVDAGTVAAANDLVWAISEVRPVVIAAVNGPAAGVGASIAISCDIVVAVESAFFVMPFLPLGLVPDGGATYALAARAGGLRAGRMVFGGERISARLADQWGLVSETVEDDTLESRVSSLVERILDAPVAAVHESKRLLRMSGRSELESALAEELAAQSGLLASDQYERARAGFLAKSPVSFREE